MALIAFLAASAAVFLAAYITLAILGRPELAGLACLAGSGCGLAVLRRQPGAGDGSYGARERGRDDWQKWSWYEE